jgi:hypothetical protein
MSFPSSSLHTGPLSLLILFFFCSELFFFSHLQSKREEMEAVLRAATPGLEDGLTAVVEARRWGDRDAGFGGW